MSTEHDPHHAPDAPDDDGWAPIPGTCSRCGQPAYLGVSRWWHLGPDCEPRGRQADFLPEQEAAMQHYGPLFVPCPKCGARITLPIAADPDRITSPSQEHPMSTISNELHALVHALESEGHALAGRARAILNKLRGDETQLATDAKTDATQVEADARPVMQEAQADAGQLATEVKTDVGGLTQPTTPTAPEPPAAA